MNSHFYYLVALFLIFLSLHAEETIAVANIETPNEIPMVQQSSTSTDARRKEEIKRTVALVNHICYLYNVLKKHNNICILYDEYDRLSIDKIDPAQFNFCQTKIKQDNGEEKSLFDVLRELQTFLNEWITKEETHQFYLEMIEDDKMAAKHDMYWELGGAVLTAVGKGFDYSKGEWVTAVTAGCSSLVKDSFESLENYEKRMAELRRRLAKQNFDFKMSKLEELHKYNDMMQRFIKDFAKEFSLDSYDILNGDQLNKFFDTVKETSDHVLIFNSLNHNEFKAQYKNYSLFWYYLATTAIEAEEYQVALEAADHFFEVNSGFIKLDVTKAYVAFAKIAAMVALQRYETEEDLEEIRRNLQFIKAVNMKDEYPDFSYQSAVILYSILRDSDEAKKQLDTLIGHLDEKYKTKLTEYCNLFKEPDKEFKLEDHVIPIDVDIHMARALYEKILRHENSPILYEAMRRLCEKITMSTTEKLYYVGEVRTEDLWKIAEKDVMGIRMYFQDEHHILWCGGWENEIVLDVPMSWFLLGEIYPKVILIKNGKKSNQLTEMFKRRTIRKNPNDLSSNIVRLRYECPKGLLQGVDAIQLDFPHKSWPVTIVYKPSAGYSMEDCAYEKEDMPFVPVEITFMHEKVKSEGDTNSPVGIRDAMERVQLYYDWNLFVSNKIVVTIPNSLFTGTNVEPDVFLSKEGKMLEHLKKSSMESKVDGYPGMRRYFYKCTTDSLENSDKIELTLPHRDTPFSITFIPSGDYTMESVESQVPFIPCKFILNGEDITAIRGMEPETRKLNMKESDSAIFNDRSRIFGVNLDELPASPNVAGIPSWILEKILKMKEKKYGTHYIVNYREGVILLRHSDGIKDYFVPTVEFTSERDAILHYTNLTKLDGDMTVEVSCFNEYGALMCNLTQAVDLKAEAVDDVRLKWPEVCQGCETPKYAMIFYYVDEDLWEEGKKEKNKKVDRPH